MAQLTLPDPVPPLGAIALDAPGLRIDLAIQQRAVMDDAKVDEYRELYLDGRDLGPVTLFFDAAAECLWLADGFHRIAAAQQAGLTTLPATLHPGDKRAALLYATGCNLHGMPMSNADKKKRVLTLLQDAEWCLWSNNTIAKHCGVSHTFVNALRTSLETVSSEKGDEETPQPRTVQYVTKHGGVATMHTGGIGSRNGTAMCAICEKPIWTSASVARGVGPVCACKGDSAASSSPSTDAPPFTLTPEPEPEAAPPAAPGYLTDAMFSGEEEWFTPPGIVERVRAVLGTIDLDPASCNVAQKTVRATRYYTKAEDGLHQPWQGTVFLNPPYATKILDRFVGRLLDELKAGSVPAAILLTNAATSPGWFQLAARMAQAVCFTHGRVSFVPPDSTRQTSAPILGQAFFYFGPDLVGFCREFQEVGVIMQLVSAPEGEAALFPVEPPAPVEAPVPDEAAAPASRPAAPVISITVPSRSAKVQAALQAHGEQGATASTLAAEIKAPRKQVWAHLEKMVKDGKARKEGITYRSLA